MPLPGSAAHHFDRVVIIVLENVDYEVAIQDKNFAAFAPGRQLHQLPRVLPSLVSELPGHGCGNRLRHPQSPRSIWLTTRSTFPTMPHTTPSLTV